MTYRIGSVTLHLMEKADRRTVRRIIREAPTIPPQPAYAGLLASP